MHKTLYLSPPRPLFVTPAKAGDHTLPHKIVDSRLRGKDNTTSHRRLCP